MGSPESDSLQRGGVISCFGYLQIQELTESNLDRRNHLVAALHCPVLSVLLYSTPYASCAAAPTYSYRVCRKQSNMQNLSADRRRLLLTSRFPLSFFRRTTWRPNAFCQNQQKSAFGRNSSVPSLRSIRDRQLNLIFRDLCCQDKREKQVRRTR